MSSRVLIPVLCIGAVAYACGPRAHSDSSAARGSTTLASAKSKAATPTRRVVAKAKEPTSVSAQLYVHAGDSAVRIAMHVANTGTKRVEITFPTGQTYDFVILDSIGREVWHWGAGRMFTQTLRNKLLDGGEALDLEETWSHGALPAGRYTARGVLKSENYPLVQQAEFTVVETVVATRENP